MPPALAPHAPRPPPLPPPYVTLDSETDPEAWRRACVELRVKIRRETGTELTTADQGRGGGLSSEQPRTLLRVLGWGDRGPNARAGLPGPLEDRVVVLPQHSSADQHTECFSKASTEGERLERHRHSVVGCPCLTCVDVASRRTSHVPMGINNVAPRAVTEAAEAPATDAPKFTIAVDSENKAMNLNS